MTPHKHADLIKAWADGAEIEILVPSKGEAQWCYVSTPCWHELEVYRLKPKPNSVTWHAVFKNGGSGDGHPDRFNAQRSLQVALLRIESDYNDPANLKLVAATLEKP